MGWKKRGKRKSGWGGDERNEVGAVRPPIELSHPLLQGSFPHPWYPAYKGEIGGEFSSSGVGGEGKAAFGFHNYAQKMAKL